MGMDKYGYVRVAAVTPDLKVAACDFNADNIIASAADAASKGCELIVFPELCITGYTCSDLFLQETLLDSAESALYKIARATKELDAVITVGLPLRAAGVLFNVAAVLQKGSIKAFVPKSYIPNYGEFYELRHFTPYSKALDVTSVCFHDEYIPFGSLLFDVECASGVYSFGVEICEDLWVPVSPSTRLAVAGAQIILNLSASNEIIGKAEYRRSIISAFSGRTVSAYVYCDAGTGESTTDMVFAGHKLICENASIKAEAEPFGDDMIMADIDVQMISSYRRRMNTYSDPYGDFGSNSCNVRRVSLRDTSADAAVRGDLLRRIDRYPFVPDDESQRKARCRLILNMQANALCKRIKHTHASTAVIGISGGLDSTLALIVTSLAFDMAGLDRNNIIAVTMPCFGTTKRTHDNAVSLCKSFGVQLREVNIEKAVLLHFSDIGHDKDVHDVTYENSQARERTQVLMDIANQENGLVIGTGDLSELALGWATYNGDHMSMYGVNASIPKTLVRHLVRYFAEVSDSNTGDVLLDVLNTPVSPELLPPKDGVISQETESLVGPYELHDFFLYYFMRCGFAPDKIMYLAQKAFGGIYEPDFILQWLKVFIRRFFNQQFKRSCLPDAPKVGTVALSPRGDWRMPSDAVCDEWNRILEQIDV